MLSNTEMWTVIVGFLLPLILSVVIQTKWSQRTQAAILFVAVLIISAVGLWIQGKFNTDDFVGTFLLIFVTAIATYHGLWKPTGVAPAIESATNLSSGAGDLK